MFVHILKYYNLWLEMVLQRVLPISGDSLIALVDAASAAMRMTRKTFIFSDSSHIPFHLLYKYEKVRQTGKIRT